MKHYYYGSKGGNFFVVPHSVTEAKSLILEISTSRHRENEEWCVILNHKAPQWHISSSKARPSNISQIVPPAVAQVFKYVSLLMPFSFKELYFPCLKMLIVIFNFERLSCLLFTIGHHYPFSLLLFKTMQINLCMKITVWLDILYSKCGR